MKSIHDDSFKSKKIDDLKKTTGGRDISNGTRNNGFTTVMTQVENSICTDGEYKDPDSGGGSDGAPSY